MNVLRFILDRYPVTVGFIVGCATCLAPSLLEEHPAAGDDGVDPAGAERVAHCELAAGVRLEREGGEAAKARAVIEAETDDCHRTVAGVRDDDKVLARGLVSATVNRDGRLTIDFPAEMKADFLKEERDGHAEERGNCR